MLDQWKNSNIWWIYQTYFFFFVIFFIENVKKIIFCWIKIKFVLVQKVEIQMNLSMNLKKIIYSQTIKRMHYHIGHDGVHQWTPLYFNKKVYRKTLSFPFFLGSVLYIMFILLCLSYFFWIIYCIAKCFSVIQSRQKKLLTVRTKGFYFFCCCQAHFSWFLLPDFLVAASTASSDIAQE